MKTLIVLAISGIIVLILLKFWTPKCPFCGSRDIEDISNGQANYHFCNCCRRTFATN